ncbi:hypothetical protein [Streptomyces gobitricini]|uniref:Integral membrane protein n=1 Tax=Streptomyces gobitricini TaxID=68211 RepID=A0ABP6AMM7_9ACTN
MTHLLSRRIAPVLVLIQVAYVALLEIAFSTLGPDTAELDHTNPSASGRLLYAAVIIGALIVLVGGAVLLGLDKARTACPGAVRTAWLAVLAIGELAIASTFLFHMAKETFGPDTLIGTAAIVVCGLIAFACASEVRVSFRRSSADAQS